MPSDPMRPLDAAKREIRLCRLAPSGRFAERPSVTLEVVSLDSDVPYDALSYVWGDRNDDTPIYMHGREVKVSVNVEKALRYLRDPLEDRLIWIDALCIKQSDLSELSAQVLLMKVVYSKAKVVRVWLGEAANDSDKAFQILTNLANGIDLCDMTIENRLLRRDDMDSIRYLGERPWWDRLWVVQEAILGNVVIMHCGTKAITLHELLKSRVQMNKEYISRRSELAERFQGFYPETLTKCLIRLYQVKTNHTGDWDGYESLISIIAHCRSSKTSNHRDKVYGLLGLAPHFDKSFIVPNYELSVEETYIQFAFQLIEQTRKLSILNQSSIPKNPLYHTPSWVPDWSISSRRSDNEARRIGYNSAFRACGPYQASAELVDNHTLRLRGVVFDIVSQTGAPKLWDQSMGEQFNTFYQWRTLLGMDSRRSRHAAYVAGGGRHLAYWLTLLNSVMSVESEVIRRCHMNDYWHYLRWWRWKKEVFNGSRYAENVSALSRAQFRAANKHTPELEDDIDSSTDGRRMMVTGKGYIGLGPAEVQCGDLVFVLEGGSQPYILRTSASSWTTDTFTLVGESYIHGIMDGQAVVMLTPTRRFRAFHKIRRALFGGAPLEYTRRQPEFKYIDIK